METVENTAKLINFVAKNYETGKLDNDSLVQLIELADRYLNLKTISKYASDNKMTYNGVKKCRKKIIVGGVKFIIDNE